MIERVRELSSWIERHIVLPDAVAEPGPIRLTTPMREIADAIGDPSIERVTASKEKSAREDPRSSRPKERLGLGSTALRMFTRNVPLSQLSTRLGFYFFA